jgi:hypothetical protein
MLHDQTPAYLHLVPIEPSECLPSWLLRISNRSIPNFRRFSTVWLSDELRVTPGFDAFPAASLLMQLGAIYPDQLDHFITHHTLLGTTKCFYTEHEWKALISTRRRVNWLLDQSVTGGLNGQSLWPTIS